MIRVFLALINIILAIILLKRKYQRSIFVWCFIEKSITFGGRIEEPVKNAYVPGPGYYKLNSTLTEAITAVKIGLSSRSNSPNPHRTDSPGPCAYNPVKKFSENKGPKFTFGIGEKCKFINRNCAPGPGSYPTQTVIGKEGTRPSIYSKRPDTSPKYGNESPGPCAYNQTIVPSRKWSISIGKGSSRSNNLSKTMLIPPPGSYEPKIDAARPSSPMWKICRTGRNSITPRTTTPDPGAYDLPSTFGKGPNIKIHGRIQQKQIEAMPGPGEYNPNHKLVLEVYPGIAMSTGPRTEKDITTRKHVPGPGHYQLKSTLQGPKFGFGIGLKCKQKRDDNIPGPGTYKVPCLFARTQKYQIPNKDMSYSFV